MNSTCDVCCERPGIRTVIVCQIETWVCDECSGNADEDYEGEDDTFSEDPEQFDRERMGL